MRMLIVIILMLLTALAHGQTHTMPGSNVVPSGASLTINSGGSITAAAGSTVTGFGAGGGVGITGTPTAGQKATWFDATHIQGVTDNALQWDGGATNLVAATGRTSLGLVIGTNVQAFESQAAGIGTWLTTPSSANLRAALTDENGTGAALFSGATTPDFTTGFTIGAAAGSGKVMKGNGTNFVPSTETYAVPGTSGNVLTSDGTNWTSAAPVVTAANTLTFTNKRVTPRVTSIASNATWSPSADTDDVYEITAQAVPTTVISNPTGTPVDGQSLIIRFSDNGTARALTWSGTQWQAGPGVSLPTTTVVGNHDYAGFKWNSTTSKWTMLASSQDASVVNAGTGFTVGGAAASGKILQGNGTNFVASTPTWPTTNTAGYHVKGDGTNFLAYPDSIANSSVSSQSPTTSDVYLTGSNVTVAAGDFKAKGQYRCLFDVTKSAGTGTIVITLRVGTAGAIGDTAILTFTLPSAGTSVSDVGTFEVIATWRTVGTGTSAVLQGICRANKNTATAAGLWGTASDSQTIVATTSSGFNSSTATNMGVSFNGSTAFAGTITLVQATLEQP